MASTIENEWDKDNIIMQKEVVPAEDWLEIACAKAIHTLSRTKNKHMCWSLV